MVHLCKYCRNILPLKKDKEGTTQSLICPFCDHYFIVFEGGDSIFSETLRAGNFYIIFLLQYQDATVAADIDNNTVIFEAIPTKELTHELAVQWINKLKTYVLFS